MLQGIFGQDAKGQKKYLYNSIGKDVANGHTVFMLVPEQASLSAEKDVINSLGIKAQNYVKIITFSHLCNMVFSNCGPLRLKYIDSAGKLLVAQRTLQQAEKDLTYLKGNVRQRGFASVLVSNISSFKRYGVTPSQLKEAGEKIEKQSLRAKVLDLATLYNTYQELLTVDYADAEDNLALACDKLADCDFLTGKLYINQFRSFTPYEYDALKILMEKMDTSIFLESDSPYSRGVFAPITKTYTDLCDIAMGAGVEVAAPVIIDKEKENTPINHLKENYFSTKPEVFSGEQNSLFVMAPGNYYAEVEETARIIKSLCRTEGYRFRDFLILSRSADDYKGILFSVFNRNEIPVFMDARRSIVTSAMVKAILAALSILAYGVSYERVMSILKSGMLGREVSRNDADIFENYLLATAPTHKMWNEGNWEYNPHKSYDMTEINRIRSAVLDPIFKMQDRIEGRKNVSQICSSLALWMQELDFSECIRERIEAFGNQGMAEKAEEERQVFGAVISIIEEMQDVLGEDMITYQKFYELFSAAASGVEVGIIPQTIDKVTFSEIDRFRSNDAKVVIVLGLNEGVFPKSFVSDGLISEDERELLSDAGVSISPSIKQRLKEEQLLIYHVLNSAGERLYLSAPVADKGGKSLAPSDIIQKLCREIFPDLKVMTFEESLPESRQDAFENLAIHLAPIKGDKDKLPPVWQKIYNYLSEDEKYAGAIGNILKGISLADNMEKLSPEMVKKLYGEVLPLSATKIEKYNACAYAFFLEFGLIARERERASFDSRGLGSILHNVLYEYFENLRENNCDYSDITRDDCEKAIYELVSVEAKKDSAEILYENSYYYRYMLLRMQGIASATAWEVVKFYRDSMFRPYGYEIRIGSSPEATLPPVKITDDNGDTIGIIDGFIDRADVTALKGKNAFCVIDYKSSGKDMDYDKAEAGVQIQPLLYSKALCDSEGGMAGAMLYMNMNDPIVKFDRPPTGEDYEKAIQKEIAMRGWICEDVAEAFESDGEKPVNLQSKTLSREEMEDAIAQMNRKLKTSAEEILSGNIGAEVYAKGMFNPCSYCPYRILCSG